MKTVLPILISILMISATLSCRAFTVTGECRKDDLPFQLEKVDPHTNGDLLKKYFPKTLDNISFSLNGTPNTVLVWISTEAEGWANMEFPIVNGSSAIRFSMAMSPAPKVSSTEHRWISCDLKLKDIPRK